MLPEKVKELLGLEETGIKDYEIIKKLKEAREKKLEEIEFVVTDKAGKRNVVKMKLRQLEPEGIMGREVYGW